MLVLGARGGDVWGSQSSCPTPQSSEAVSLELLTYSDLEALRCCKAGVATHVPPSASPLSSKRYLILVYCVEFDR